MHSELPYLLNCSSIYICSQMINNTRPQNRNLLKEKWLHSTNNKIISRVLRITQKHQGKKCDHRWRYGSIQLINHHFISYTCNCNWEQNKALCNVRGLAGWLAEVVAIFSPKTKKDNALFLLQRLPPFHFLPLTSSSITFLTSPFTTNFSVSFLLFSSLCINPCKESRKLLRQQREEQFCFCWEKGWNGFSLLIQTHTGGYAAMNACFATDP